MVWINWSGYVPEQPDKFAFGRKQHPTKQAALDDWTGKGNDPAVAQITWHPLPGEPDNPFSEVAPHRSPTQRKESDFNNPDNVFERGGVSYLKGGVVFPNGDYCTEDAVWGDDGWVCLSGWKNKKSKPPVRGEDETPIENYRGYIIKKTANSQYHLYDKNDNGLGFYLSLNAARQGADGDVEQDPEVIQERQRIAYEDEQRKKQREQDKANKKAQKEIAKSEPPCPRGDSYSKPFGWPVVGCDDGYMGQIGGDNCYCTSGQKVPQAIKDIGAIERGADPGDTPTFKESESAMSSLNTLMKYFPYIIVLSIVGAVVGAFKK